MKPHPRNFGLDVVRAGAIALVVFAHVLVWYLEVFPAFPLRQTAQALSHLLGIFGVELFFALSGFLMGRALLKGQPNWRHFYLRRALRTLPAYFVVLALLVLANYYWPMAGGSNWRYLLLLQSTEYRGSLFFGVSWALCVEEWFYLLLPLAIIALRGQRSKALPLLYIALLLAAWRIFYAHFEYPEFVLQQRNPFLRLDALLYGVIVTAMKLERPALYKRLQTRWMPLIVFAFAWAALAMVWLYYVYRFSFGFVSESPAMMAVYLMLLPLGFALCLPYMEKNRWLNRQFSAIPRVGRAVTLLSVGSYSLYLVHYDWFMLLWKNNTVIAHAWWGPLLGLALSLASACALYQLVEKPFIRLRERFR